MKRLALSWAVFALLFVLGAALPTAARETPAADTSCTICHRDPELIDDASWLAIVDDFAHDVHGEIGLSCHDCHGGNPDPALADDMLAAMDESFADKPFRSRPEKAEIPKLCGTCHSDPSYMKHYRPDARIDQEERYWTSHHGQALEQGDPNVATCVDCHGVHGIRRPVDPESKVYPTQVAGTCGHCHSDPELMAPYTLPNGQPLPVDQVERWKRSVHGHAMTDKEDLFAPTCNDCHGNHGATPPGHDDVSLVCGQCHGREARLFRASPKAEGLALHNELQLPDMENGCGDCHEAPEPQAEITHIREFSECVTCHGNHSVARPTQALLGFLPETPCALCHEGPSPVDTDFQESERIQRSYTARRDELLATAAGQGIEGEDRFDWLVDQALQLPNHTRPGADGKVLPRPEFERLFTKFRIGKTTTSFLDPRTGQVVQEKLVRCSQCHAEQPELADEGIGLRTAKEYRERMHELMVLSARAERTLLAARRGGVEVREVLTDIDQAIDRQIDLEVMVHAFSSAADSEFLKKHAEGMEHARSALAGAESALDELAYRRRGLYVSLGLILLVLVALGLKIRRLPPP